MDNWTLIATIPTQQRFLMLLVSSLGRCGHWRDWVVGYPKRYPSEQLVSCLQMLTQAPVWCVLLRFLSLDTYSMYTSIAARGGGGSFKRLKIYNSEEHVPIESFVTTLIHWKFFLMTRTKLAFVGFVAAGNSMWHQVLDDLCLVVTDQSATTCDSSYAPNSTQYNSVLQSSEKCYPSTILYYKVLLQKVLLQYYKVLIQYYSVLQSTTPVLQSTTKYYKVLQSTSPVILRTTKYYSSTTPYYKVLLQYYSVLQSTTPVLLRTTKY